MRKTEFTQAFKRDWKRDLSGPHGKKLRALLDAVLDYLEADRPLPAAHVDHPLTGNLKGYRDCHLRGDLVLIYRKCDNEILQLVRLGSHSELFR